MAFHKKTIRDIELDGKRVLVRVDYNVPLSETGEITDDLRVRAGLPTLRYLLERNCRLVLMSHLGRPDGKADASFSLRPLAECLEKLLSRPVEFVEDALGETDKDTPVTLLENLRFYPEEEADDPGFAKKLSRNGEIYVDDAFGVVHHPGASLVAITKYLPSVAGLLLEKEVSTITKALENPKRPFWAVLGGAKIADKIELIEALMKQVDGFLIAGAMANTFLSAQGKPIGKSKYDADGVSEAKRILKLAQEKDVELVLPDRDAVVAKKVEAEASHRNVALSDIEDDDMILDIGAEDLKTFEKRAAAAGTVIWNGTLGITELKPFDKGSKAFAKALAESPADVIIGGGDTAGFIDSIGMFEKFTHVSTGGGASLELMAGKKLPGVAALLDADTQA